MTNSAMWLSRFAENDGLLGLRAIDGRDVAGTRMHGTVVCGLS
jgi:hypothetical protein